MKTENLSTLTIHKISQEQYDREKAAGRLDANAVYLTPDEDGNSGGSVGSLTDLGVTATAAELNILDGVTATTAEINYVDGVTSNIQTQLNNKVPTNRTINGKALTGNISLGASDVSAVPTTRKVNGKALSSDITLSAADVSAYTKAQIDAMEFITVADIDTICGTTIQVADANDGSVTF